MKKMSAKERMLQTLKKSTGYNTFSVAQARSRFGIKNVAARIHELRKQGYAIYTNIKSRADGTKVAVYRLGSASKSFKTQCRKSGISVQAV